MTLKGNIQIVYKDYHIKADEADIQLKTKRIHLKGRVLMTQPKSIIGGDQVWFDYEANTGLISNGFVQSGNVIFEGELINKTGENDYYVLKADYTTCNNCPASWSFEGAQIRAELGGYAYIKNSFFKIGSIPVFWLPYLIVPLKSDRQSGLLTPEFESSQAGGLTISQPFFWVISRSEDLTYTIKSYELRGIKHLFNYRFVSNEQSYGELNTGFLKDKVFQNDDRLNAFRNSDEKGQTPLRWFLKYDHYISLPNDYIHRFQINNASDLQYPKDFPKESRNHNEPSFENRMSLTKNYEKFHTHIDTSYNVNLLKSNPIGNNDDSVHRVPEIKISKVPEPLFEDSNLLYSIDFDYLNLSRSGKSYDDLTTVTDSKGQVTQRFPSNSCDSPLFDRDPNCKLTNDGKFDPYADLIRTGQRFDFKPTLSYPINLNDTVDILPKIIYRDTQYQFQLNDDSTVYRRYLKTEVAARTQLNRIFDFGDSIQDRRWRHEIIPQITYRKTPWVDRKQHPFWGFDQNNQIEIPFTSQDRVTDGTLASPYGLQFDYLDRSLDREIITMSVLQRITEKKWINNNPVYKQLASLTVSQSYDVYQNSLSSPTKEPWSDIQTNLSINLDSFSTNSQFNYYPYQKVTNISSSFRFTNEFGNFFEVGYNRSFGVTPGKDVDASSRTEDYLVRSGVLTKYFNVIGEFVYDGNWINRSENKKIKSWAYVSQFKPPGDCWLITLAQYQVPSGSPEMRLSFEFTYDGNAKSPLNGQALSELIK